MTDTSSPAVESNNKPVAPGNILQRMYLRQRLRRRPAGFFYEFGAGAGQLSQLLLALGYEGHGFDLGEQADRLNRTLNAASLSTGRYQVTCGDMLQTKAERHADLVISSMVLEHLPETEVTAYFRWCRDALAPDGMVITFVPAGPQFWGIEDEIAGHLHRYTREMLRQTAADAGFEVRHLAGLTWPVSNFLLPISNFLVRRYEHHKTRQSLLDRTVASGARDVPLKTRFPPLLGLILNEYAMLPLHILQLIGRDQESAMVLYCEMGLPS